MKKVTILIALFSHKRQPVGGLFLYAFLEKVHIGIVTKNGVMTLKQMLQAFIQKY